MKLLLFSDVHADRAAATRLAKLAEGVDVVVGAGDFGRVRREVPVCIAILRRIHIPAVLVPGNAETDEELRAACKDWPEAIVLHGSGVEIGGIPFFGIGGGIPVTPFGSWSYDFSEEDGERLLTNCPAGAVLVSHSPPLGAVDTDSSGRHLGSKAVRDAVVRTRPKLVVCGHIHASAGQKAFIDSTPVVNAGPAGMLWTI